MPNPENYLRQQFMKTFYRENFCENDEILARRIGIKSFLLLREKNLKDICYEDILEKTCEQKLEDWCKAQKDEEFLFVIFEALRAMKARLQFDQCKSEFQEKYCRFKSKKGKINLN